MKNLAKKRAQVDLKIGQVKMKPYEGSMNDPYESETGGTLQIGEPTVTEDKDVVSVDHPAESYNFKDKQGVQEHEGRRESQKKFEMMTGLLTKMDDMDKKKAAAK